MKKKSLLEELARQIRNGLNVGGLSRSEVLALQEFALDIKDLDLYDRLEEYWDRGL